MISVEWYEIKPKMFYFWIDANKEMIVARGNACNQPKLTSTFITSTKVVKDQTKKTSIAMEALRKWLECACEVEHFYSI